jgi:hypothetical protein
MDIAARDRLLGCIGESLGRPEAPDPQLGAAIARLTGLHLAALPEWKYRWLDDLLDVRVERGGEAIDVLGYVVWGDRGATAQWMDPLHGHFTRDGSGTILRYALHFCDERRPSQPYKLHRKFQPSKDCMWRYSFVNIVGR